MQERDLTAAAEKLAECQETILLLGKQLNSLRPQTEANDSPYSKINPKDEGFTEDEHTTNGQKFQELGQLEMDSSTSAFVPRLSSESPLHFSNSLFSPSDSESTIPARSPVQHSKSKPKHRPTKSASCSVSSATTPEKHARGFSRFFSPKGKSGH